MSMRRSNGPTCAMRTTRSSQSTPLTGRCLASQGWLPRQTGRRCAVQKGLVLKLGVL